MTKIKPDGAPTEEDDDRVSVDGTFSTNPRARLMAELMADEHIRIEGDQATALADRDLLYLDHFMDLTGVAPDGNDEWDLYRVTTDGVSFIGLEMSSFSGRSEQTKVAAALNRAPSLPFPCTPGDLVAFVDDPKTVPGHFSLPDEFRTRVRALTERERKRDGGEIQEDIDLAKTLAQNPEDYKELFRILAARAGDGGRILEATANALIWRSSKSGLEKLSKEALRSRIGRDKARRSDKPVRPGKDQ